MSDWVLLVRGATEDDRAAAVSCAVAAAALGIEVRLVWDGAALRGRLENSAGRDEEILTAAGDDLPIRHFACSAAAASDLEAVRGRIGEPVGWATVVGWIRRAERVLSF